MIPLNVASHCLETAAGERPNRSPLSFGALRPTAALDIAPIWRTVFHIGKTREETPWPTTPPLSAMLGLTRYFEIDSRIAGAHYAWASWSMRLALEGGEDPRANGPAVQRARQGQDSSSPVRTIAGGKFPYRYRLSPFSGHRPALVSDLFPIT